MINPPPTTTPSSRRPSHPTSSADDSRPQMTIEGAIWPVQPAATDGRQWGNVPLRYGGSHSAGDSKCSCVLAQDHPRESHTPSHKGSRRALGPRRRRHASVPGDRDANGRILYRHGQRLQVLMCITARASFSADPMPKTHRRVMPFFFFLLLLLFFFSSIHTYIHSSHCHCHSTACCNFIASSHL
ncbi:hypothetical protein K504DRAFT_120381 [Pleomassaria siparia CBS 279.74]|uniref:Uncharacterized protein n=1 Tax=Pleomassaria siparia CBS 279.74 TaxID=1314801 RepID=A0A6G1JVD9_9PLEO|nr:hypothetical protein K504DRAFT_120381 [Pleomassaria siparia CBS 279.74]